MTARVASLAMTVYCTFSPEPLSTPFDQLGADAGGRRLRRRGVATRDGLAHEGVKGLFDPAVEYLVGAMGGVLKLHDIHVLAESLAEQFDRVRRRTVGVWRVDSNHAGDAVDVPQRHLPDDKAAPVVADENRLVDFEMVEQADEIAGQVLHIVGLDGLGPVGRAIAALIGRNHPDPGRSERLDLVAPRKRDLRPAVAENDRRRVGFRSGLVITHATA